MKTIPYPSNFHTWGFTVKAAWLHNNHYAPSYPKACSMLASHRRTNPKPVPPERVYAEMEKRRLA